MSTLRRLLERLGTVGTLLRGAGAFFVSGSPRKSTSDPDEELRAAFEAWARSGSEVASGIDVAQDTNTGPLIATGRVTSVARTDRISSSRR